jgi:hypothetical protein
MKDTKFCCPRCHQEIEGFFIPPDQILTDNARDHVCRCPHCGGDIDDQVQLMLELIIQEEELKEWLWQERFKLVRAIETYEELEHYWRRYPPPAEGE